MKKRTSLFLCIALTAAMALSTAGCSDNTKNGVSASPTSNAGSASDTTVLGEGSTNFAFTVTDQDGKYWAFYTDGEYALTGVDSTPITDRTTYSFKIE